MPETTGRVKSASWRHNMTGRYAYGIDRRELG